MPPSTAESPGSLIGPDQIEHFRRTGYCIVEGLWTPAELAEIEAFFEDFKRAGAPVFDGDARFEEIDPAKRQLRAMHPHRYSERVKQWALNPCVVSVLTALLGSAPLLAQTMYYFKPPGAKGQGMHQDNFYLLSKPHTCIAAWTAIDDARIDNGCLYVAPASHEKEILCGNEPAEGWMNYGDTHIRPFPRDLKPVPVEVPRGATMFFSGNLVHGSGPNRTADRSRRTFIGHYIDEMSEQVSSFYHPVLDTRGNVVSHLREPMGGGPCGDGWAGATH